MISVDVTVNFDGLAKIKSGIVKAIVKSIERGSEAFMAHARDEHGPSAHSNQRFITRSGALIQGIRIMPVRDEGDAIVGGIILFADHSIYVEDGHDIVSDGQVVGHAPAYPFMKVAIENKEAQQFLIDSIAYEIGEYLNG